MHKAARECPILEPHPRNTCGIVKARQTRQSAQTPEKHDGHGEG